MALTTRYVMIDNYIYLYHTGTLFVVPSFVDGVTDSTSVNFSPSTPLARTAPIYSYQNSGPRSLRIDFNLHRDLMKEINYKTSNINPNAGDDYVGYLIKAIQAAALPTYDAASKMVNPPVVAVKLGEDIFIKGVITGDVAVTYNFPIIENGHYADVRFGFNISEIDPYDAYEVMKVGSYRGVPLTLDRTITSARIAFNSTRATVAPAKPTTVTPINKLTGTAGGAEAGAVLGLETMRAGNAGKVNSTPGGGGLKIAQTK